MNKLRFLLVALSLSIVAACAPTDGYYAQQTVYNPCDQYTFDPIACQQAIAARGFYNNGVWIAMAYTHPYTYYNNTYTVFRSRGGVIRRTPSNIYSRNRVYTSPGTRSTTQSGGYSGSRSTYQSRPRTAVPRSTYSAPRRTYSSPSRSSSSSRRH